MKLVNERAKQEEKKRASEVAFLYLYIASGRWQVWLFGCVAASFVYICTTGTTSSLSLYHRNDNKKKQRKNTT
jgi:hypothetical protein